MGCNYAGKICFRIGDVISGDHFIFPNWQPKTRSGGFLLFHASAFYLSSEGHCSDTPAVKSVDICNFKKWPP